MSSYFDIVYLTEFCSADDVEGLDNLRWEDQVKIRAYAEGSTAPTQDEEDTDVATSGGDGDYAIEVAKSSRATCKSCNEKIEKGQVCIL